MLAMWSWNQRQDWAKVIHPEAVNTQMVLKPQVWERPPQSKSEAQGQSPQARSEAKKEELERQQSVRERKNQARSTQTSKKKPQRLNLLLNFAAPNQNKVLANKTEQ